MKQIWLYSFDYANANHVSPGITGLFGGKWCNNDGFSF